MCLCLRLLLLELDWLVLGELARVIHLVFLHLFKLFQKKLL